MRLVAVKVFGKVSIVLQFRRIFLDAKVGVKLAKVTSVLQLCARSHLADETLAETQAGGVQLQQPRLADVQQCCKKTLPNSREKPTLKPR
jgi:hypothetical protein